MAALAALAALAMGSGLPVDGWPIARATVAGTRTPTVVVFGDSLTVGIHYGATRRDPYASVLAARLGASGRVVNAGIGGNALGIVVPRWTNGAPGVQRFGVDALAVPGVRVVIVFEGINDVMSGGSVAEVVGALRRIVAQAHARRVRVILATLTPYDRCYRYTQRGEAMRETINRWIRTAGVADGEIDFDAIMRDAHDPRRLNPRYDSGDGIHPTAAGYAHMADVIPLSLVRPS